MRTAQLGSELPETDQERRTLLAGVVTPVGAELVAAVAGSCAPIGWRRSHGLTGPGHS